MIPLGWSFALATLGVTGLFITYHRPASRIGPAIGCGVQALWLAYALATAQWWFIGSAIAYAGVNAYGLTRRAHTMKETECRS